VEISTALFAFAVLQMLFAMQHALRCRLWLFQRYNFFAEVLDRVAGLFV
jgi:hypothetical protein